MANTTVDVIDAKGKKSGSVELPASIFDVQTNVPLIHQVVTAQLAAARQGTHKVKGRGEKRVESLRIADIFRSRVVDSTATSFVFEMTGSTEKIDAFIDLMRPLGLIDVSRTGIVAISRGTDPF